MQSFLPFLHLPCEFYYQVPRSSLAHTLEEIDPSKQFELYLALQLLIKEMINILTETPVERSRNPQ